MSLVIRMDPPVLCVDAAGEVRVGKSRVLLDLVIDAFQQGAPPEVIVQMYSTLLLPDVYAAIAYYLHHRAEVDEYLRERAREAEEIRRQNRARFPTDGVRERLLNRLAERERGPADAAPGFCGGSPRGDSSTQLVKRRV